MALLLSTQLETLEREKLRLEELLMLDANWRALRDLIDRDASGQEGLCAFSAKRKTELEQALKANRIYVARAKLMETIELLSGPNGFAAGSETGKLASRIVMLSEPTGDKFRAKLRVKTAEAKAVQAPARDEPEQASADVKSPAPSDASALAPREADRAQADRVQVPDALMLIDGLGGRAVELLQEAGMTRFSHIAEWSSADAAVWRDRLHGIASGSTGSWIEQAAMLARGHATAFSSRLRRGEFAALVPAPEPEPLPLIDLAMDAAEAANETPGETEAKQASDDVAARQDEVQPKKQRLKSAQEIAEALAAHEAAYVKQRPATASEAVEAPDQGAAEAIGLRPAKGAARYTRPQPRRGAADPQSESEVTVVSREAPDKRSLLGRLKDIGDPQRFESANYAAYRGEVEEASVTIVRAAPVAAKGPEAAASPAVADEAPPQKSSRFLKALTGRG